MLISKLIGERKRNAPSDALLKSHALLLKAGYLKQVSSGIFSLSAGGLRMAQKIESIIRREMDALPASQEVKLPVVLPQEMWEESGRFASVGEELVRLKDRAGRGLLLGMTHEEAAVDLARANVVSYNQLPFMIYQIQTKFRDEARSRGGLIRVREFVMKDAYSFHATNKELKNYYDKVLKAYVRIFNAIGIKNLVVVASDTGMMGGSGAHEFMQINENGEDTLVLCPHCDYKANMEVAACLYEKEPQAATMGIEQVFTDKLKEIGELEQVLGLSAKQFIKAVVFYKKGTTELVCAFLRGDLEINEAKLKKVLGFEIVPCSADKEQHRDIAFGNIGCINPTGFTKVVFDSSLKYATDMVCGANKEGYHLKGVSMARDTAVKAYYDIAKAKDGDKCPKCGERVELKNGIEVGNIFQLGVKYSKAMNFLVAGVDGVGFNPIMGCYGIGVGRSLACVCEENCDEKGLNLPISVAPWQVYLCGLRLDDAKTNQIAQKIYKKLQSAGIEVLFDDRLGVSAGNKFNDCDLMGIPIRVIISPKAIERGIAEISANRGKISCECELGNISLAVKKVIKQLKT